MTDDRQPTRPVPLPGSPAEGKGTVSVAHVQLGARAIELLREIEGLNPESTRIAADAVIASLLRQLDFRAVADEWQETIRRSG